MEEHGWFYRARLSTDGFMSLALSRQVSLAFSFFLENAFEAAGQDRLLVSKIVVLGVQGFCLKTGLG